jgi:hypothetical protein
VLFLQRDAALTLQARWCVTRALSSPHFHIDDSRVYIIVAVLILLIGRSRSSTIHGGGKRRAGIARFVEQIAICRASDNLR